VGENFHRTAARERDRSHGSPRPVIEEVNGTSANDASAFLPKQDAP
jgi:hypothetical protein